MQVCMYICGTLPFRILRDTIQHVRGTRFKLDSIANFLNFWTAYDPCETSLCFLLLFFYTPNSFLYFICFTIPPCFRLFSFCFLPLFLNLFSTFVYFIFLSFRFISFLFARTFRFHSYSLVYFHFRRRMFEDVTQNFMHRQVGMRDTSGIAAACKIFRWDPPERCLLNFVYRIIPAYRETYYGRTISRQRDFVPSRLRFPFGTGFLLIFPSIRCSLHRIKRSR